VTEYPRDLSKSATVYLRSPNDVNVSVLQNNIAQYASLLNNLTGSDTPLGLQMGSTGSPFESLNNQAPGRTSQTP